jgi:hypothetical protein
MLDSLATVDPLESFTTTARFNGVQMGSRIVPVPGAVHGGDWCDAFPVNGDVIALSIGDVCGHGVEKFESMVAVRQSIRSAALKGLDPAQTLAEANRFLWGSAPGEIATAIFALLDTRRRSLVYANAGHPPPLVAGPFGALFLEYPATDLPLGIDREFMATTHEVSLSAGTLLVLYTDGVSESRRDSVQGSRRLCAAARFARDSAELPTATTIAEMTIPIGSNFDDAAILTVRTPSFPIVRNRRKNGFAYGAQMGFANAGLAAIRTRSTGAHADRARLRFARTNAVPVNVGVFFG